MKQIKNGFSLLSRLSDSFVPLILSAFIIPILILLVAGGYFLFIEGYLFYFILLITGLGLGIYLLNILIKKKKIVNKNILLEDDVRIEPSPQWSEFDNKIWMEIDDYINKKIETEIEWNELQTYSLEITSLVAEHYNPENSEKELAFSLNELLLALEEVSRRYRKYIDENIPFSNEISLSLLKQVYNHKDKLKKIEFAHNIYRVARFANPASAIASEMKGFVTAKLFSNVSDSLQDKLKRVLLKEVASVAIDLYSGNFKVEESALEESKISVKDKNNKAVKIEPLRVVIVGQINAGKSSVVNALVEKMVAEVSMLPATDKIAVHKCKIDNIDLLNLVDTFGLDGETKNEALILNEMIESDLILWVLKANQSARKLDTELKNKFDAFYTKSENRSRIKPKILLLVNQVDKLQPVEEWNPPYNLIDCNISDKKACTIQDAIKYNQKILNPDNILALSIKPNDKHFNVNELKKYLVESYSTGVNTQLNRRRLEYSPSDFQEQVKRFARLAKQLYAL